MTVTAAPARKAYPSHGKLVGKWMETFLVHGPGPVMGQPYRLQPFQKRFIHELYRYDPETGRRITRKALLGIGKGNAKTELLAAIALAELAGPLAPPAPNIPVGAASYAQAGILFETARTMVEEGPLKPYLECFEDKIKRTDGPGVLYKVAAEAGTNDGTRPSLFIADEVHEWTGRKERVHLVIGNSLQKNAEGLEINISTAGFDQNSLLGRLYDYGMKVNSGEIEDLSFLFHWYSADPELQLGDPDQLVEAIKQANPGAGIFWPIDNVVRRYRDPGVPEFEFRRYHLNQWTFSDEAWLPAGAWDALVDGRRNIKPRDKVVLGLDGSYSGDATALVAVTVDETPHVQVINCWERPAGAPDDWTVPILEVENAVREACRTYDVIEVACDPYRWQRSMDVLAAERIPVVKFDQTPAQMSPATVLFMEAVGNGLLTHDGDPRLARHVGNGVVKNDGRGPRLMKANKNSTRHIDLAVAAVMAHSRAKHNARKKSTAQFISLDSYL